MASIWQKHPFRLLQYLEWVLLGIALLTVFSSAIVPPRHQLAAHPPLYGLAGRVHLSFAIGRKAQGTFTEFKYLNT